MLRHGKETKLQILFSASRKAKVTTPSLFKGHGKATAEPLQAAGGADRQFYLAMWEQQRSPPPAVTHTACVYNLSLKVHRQIDTGDIIATVMWRFQI